MMYVVENTGGNLSRHRRLVGAISSLSFLSLSLYIYFLLPSIATKKKIKISNITDPKISKKKRGERERKGDKNTNNFQIEAKSRKSTKRKSTMSRWNRCTTTMKSSSKQNPVSSAAQKAPFKTPPSFFGIRKSRRYPLLLLPSVTRALSGYTAD